MSSPNASQRKSFIHRDIVILGHPMQRMTAFGIPKTKDILDLLNQEQLLSYHGILLKTSFVAN